MISKILRTFVLFISLNKHYNLISPYSILSNRFHRFWEIRWKIAKHTWSIGSIAASYVLRGFPTRPTWEMNICEALTVALLNPNKYISWDCPVPLTHYTMVFWGLWNHDVWLGCKSRWYIQLQKVVCSSLISQSVYLKIRSSSNKVTLKLLHISIQICEC